MTALCNPSKLDPAPSPRLGAALMAVVLGTLLWSGFSPAERYTWALEIVPVVIGAPLLLLTHKRFPLTRTAMLAMATYSVVLLIGGHYTYAQAPPGAWLRDLLKLERNPYDRVGHVLQGLVPALLARELLLRKTSLGSGGWLLFLATTVGLSVSALYEILEWPATLVASALTGEGAEGFLETQGDVFDSPKDMAFALCGALLGQLAFARIHNKQLCIPAAANAADPQAEGSESGGPNQKRAA